MKSSAGIALAAACFVAPLPAAAAAAASQAIARIEAHLRPVVTVRGRPLRERTLAQEMAAHHVPSVSIAVADHGKLIWAKAYGLADVAEGREATPRTLYQAGSVSKPVAASGAMRLVQAGRLTLDAPANQQLTSWKIPDNSFTEGHPVTLRNLLTHTAGTTVHGFPGYAAGASVPSVVQVLEGKAPANTPAVVVERQPGTLWNYSGGGITIAQLAMTDAAREPFPAIMRREVFAPLGMADSTYEQPLPAARAPQAASGYQRGGAPVAGGFHTYPEMAAAGLWTTPSDLVRWSVALADAYEGRSARLMSQASARTMLTPGLGHWGIGIGVEGAGPDLRFQHDGDDAGFKATLTGWPAGGRAIVVMANGDDAMSVITEVAQAVAREYRWKGLEPKVIDAVSLTAAQRQELVGRFGKGLVAITAEGDDLNLTYGGATVELIPTGGDAFLADPGGAAIQIKLGRSPDGRIATLSGQGLTIPRDP